MSDATAARTARRLHKIGFVPSSDEGAFGFLDPADVVRACHLIPAFADGRTTALLGFSPIARAPDVRDDWERFYVNRCVSQPLCTHH